MLKIKQYLALLFIFLLIGLPSYGREPKVFRIGTGTPGGTYFTMGALIAHAISNPEGSRECSRGGSCGVPGLEAVSKSSEGSVENIYNLRTGKVEAAIVQSDIAWLAYEGKGEFSLDGPFQDLVAISILWPEDLHLIVRTDQKISQITDLYNRSISLGAIGSGTLLNAELTLYAQDISIAQINPYYDGLSQSGRNLAVKDIDAFFLMAGWPVGIVDVLLEDNTADLLNFNEAIIEKLTSEHSWLRRSIIPKSAYNLDHDTLTISQDSLLVTTKKQADDLVYAITNAIWNTNNHDIYARGFQGQDLMQISRQDTQAVIPFHPGAIQWRKQELPKRLSKTQ